jgi:hypothetical protein
LEKVHLPGQFFSYKTKAYVYIERLSRRPGKKSAAQEARLSVLVGRCRPGAAVTGFGSLRWPVPAGECLQSLGQGGGNG